MALSGLLILNSLRHFGVGVSRSRPSPGCQKSAATMDARRLKKRSLVKKSFVIIITVALYTDVAKCLHPASSVTGQAAYDDFASAQCLKKPPPSSYGGGIIVNSEMDDGLRGWSSFGSCKLEVRSDGGNKFMVATARKHGYDSASQKLNLTQGLKYTLAAWVQISGGNSSSAVVKATVAMDGGKSYSCAGTVIAGKGCWSLLKGGLSPDLSPSSATIYFESQDVSVEIWLDSVSLQPFNDQQWRSQQNASIEKNRKRDIMVHVVDRRGLPLRGAKINITQTRMGFPLGSAVANTILGNVPYQKWFAKRFNVATFENELKWYSTERQRGRVNYNDADDLLAFCKGNNISMRGHNIFWEDPQYTPGWVKNLKAEELKTAVESRIRSVVGRYAGEFLNWDVSNEMLHFSFYEDRLGPNASSYFYDIAQSLDPRTPMFMNEYNTIETCNDLQAMPDAYLQRLDNIESTDGGKVIEGIGLESHFSKPNLPLVRSILDKFGSTGLPIWLTELDITSSVDRKTQAEYLEEILREAFSHPAVDGIVMWSAWHPNGCYRMCLTDNNFNNLPAGDVVDRLIGEWTTTGITGTTDDEGYIKFSGFHGEYTATMADSHHTTTAASFKVYKEDREESQRIHLRF